MKKISLLIALCAMIMPSFVLAQDMTVTGTTTSHYTVRRGDTLDQIARMFGVVKEEIAKYNGLSIDATLPEGKKIGIPAGVVYTSPKIEEVRLGAVEQLELHAVNESEKTDLEKRAERKAKIDGLIASYGNTDSDIVLLIKLLIALDIIQV